MKAIVTKPIFSMLEGYAPIKNLIGVGDPNVHFIDGQWCMFFGGFQTNFKNNIFLAALPPGAPLHTNTAWVIESGNNVRIAKPLVAQPSKGSWDYYGLHEPCFVEGVDTKGNICRRIYYTGRSSAKVHGIGSAFSIGFMEWKSEQWVRHQSPVVRGDEVNPSALGLKVIYDKGIWKMWYRATPQEPVKGRYPETSIYYTESKDGITWREPSVFFDKRAEIAHAHVKRIGNRFMMLASTSPNLFHESPYPPQKLWLRSAVHASGDVRQWSNPEVVLSAEGGEDWYRGGFFGASLCQGEEGNLFIFFTGVNLPINWFFYSMKRLLHFRRPPFPAPYFFTIGKAEIKR